MNNVNSEENCIFLTYQRVSVVRQSVVDIISDQLHVRFYHLEWND